MVLCSKSKSVFIQQVWQQFINRLGNSKKLMDLKLTSSWFSPTLEDSFTLGILCLVICLGQYLSTALIWKLLVNCSTLEHHMTICSCIRTKMKRRSRNRVRILPMQRSMKLTCTEKFISAIIKDAVYFLCTTLDTSWRTAAGTAYLIGIASCYSSRTLSRRDWGRTLISLTSWSDWGSCK